jgi:hypothetical protein
MKNQTGGDPSVLPADKLQVREVRENFPPGLCRAAGLRLVDGVDWRFSSCTSW